MKKAEEVEKKVSSKRDSESLDDLVASLPVPKIKPKAEQKKDIKGSDEKIIEVENVVKECLDALEEYDLIRLVPLAKAIGFKEIGENKELLCDGIIKLGEALTFCRNYDSAISIEARIIKDAYSCADARNYFVHHHLYETRLNKHITTRMHINEVANFINEIEGKLKKLQECSQKYGLNKLSKPIRAGSNDFDFEYSHFVECLKAELTDLKHILENPDCINKINSDKKLKASLNNHIRNILVIMVDLTDVNSTNKNKDDPSCSAQKAAVKKINEEFGREFVESFEFFNKLKECRNSLCHLDPELQKPYTNYEQMLEFAKDLLNIEKSGYVNRLENCLLQKKEESHKRGMTNLASSPIQPLAPDAETVKSEKETPKEKEKEEKNSAALDALSEYQTPPSSPRMGGHS